MSRYWVSWYSGNYADEGCTKPPFPFFVSGYRDRNGDSDRDDCSICALFDASDEQAIWLLVRKHFPDCEERFIEPVAGDWLPNNRFPGAESYAIDPTDRPLNGDGGE